MSTLSNEQHVGLQREIKDLNAKLEEHMTMANNEAAGPAHSASGQAHGTADAERAKRYDKSPELRREPAMVPSGSDKHWRR